MSASCHASPRSAGVTAADVDARVAPLLAEAKAARKALMGAKPFW